MADGPAERSQNERVEKARERERKGERETRTA